MTASIPQLIIEYASILEKTGIDQAKAEIETILCHLLGTDRLHLYLDGASLVEEGTLVKLDNIVQKRATRYPLQYLLGKAWFYDRSFQVCPDVMVPRPETEVLCEAAIRFVEENKMRAPRILDLGVGSGVIAVTMAVELDDCRVVAMDISPQAIEVASHNAETSGVGDRIELRQSDYFAAIADDERFDLILSNPPYVSEEEYATLPPEVHADPKIALLAGDDGLDAIRVIIRQAPDYVARAGRIMFEVGDKQAEAVTALAARDSRYHATAFVKDLNNVDRVAILSCRE